MLKIILLNFIFFSSFLISFGKSDTIYIDKLCKKVQKEYASYKRVIEKEGESFRVKDFYLSGQLFMDAFCSRVKNGSTLTFNGPCNYYYPDGKKKIEGLFFNNFPQKIWKYYSADGVDTIITEYDKSGKINFIQNTVKLWEPFKSDTTSNIEEKIKPSAKDTINDTDEKYLPNIEIDAKYPGGEKEFNKLMAKITYPKEALYRNISGKIKIYFEINKEGKVCNIRALSFIGFGLEEEALRVIKSMPAWIPATLNGKPGKVKRIIPISFRLPD